MTNDSMLEFPPTFPCDRCGIPVDADSACYLDPSLGPGQPARNPGRDLEMVCRDCFAFETHPTCSLCKCPKVGTLYGFVVCDYHAGHGEDDDPCPNCQQAPALPLHGAPSGASFGVGWGRPG